MKRVSSYTGMPYSKKGEDTVMREYAVIDTTV